MDLLRAEHIVKNYSGHCALNDVSIAIPENSIYGLLGPNGAGKTSLIRIITQITAPDKGEVYFRNEKLSLHHAASTGYLPEERGLYKKMRVSDQLIYLARLKGLSLKEARERTGNWLGKLELTSWADHAVEDLSKGMQQKVQFIAAVIHEPSLMILDEPFTGFDPINAELVKNEILRLRAQGATVVLSTHRLESVEELCDHIALIHKAEKVLEGKVDDIKGQFRENIFVVEGIGEITEDDDVRIIDKSEEGAIHKYRIKTSGLKENELLHKVMKTMAVKGFREEVPSIQQIFIHQVRDRS